MGFNSGRKGTELKPYSHIINKLIIIEFWGVFRLSSAQHQHRTQHHQEYQQINNEGNAPQVAAGNVLVLVIEKLPAFSLVYKISGEEICYQLK